ncbi:addiction module toxin RelE [Candidatus Woesearchaeota archaeon]|nr:addiction module toxin RelE [Candidatus Woesearchaeota archaeon]
MFSFNISDNLKIKIRKLVKRDKKKVDIVNKKIKEIINSTKESIDHYKNLKYDFSDRKRVHIDNNFVLTFKVDKNKEHVIFLDLDHHDNIY